MNKLNDNRVDGFLERVERQIYTEDSANDIKEELTDHIECLIADYEESGLEEEDAVSKALLQMGDPQEIGYAFTDYDGMKKRKYLMLFFKITSILMLFVTFLPVFVTSNGGMSFSVDISESASLIPNLINAWLLMTTGTLLLGHSTKFLELDSTPFAIIWPVKERFKWEYLLLAVFFVPLAVVFLFVYFYEEGVNTPSILAMWPMITLTYAVWAFMFKEKFRIPKVMIINDGFIIKGRFTSWTAIASYTWTKDFFAKDQSNYKLVLNMFQVNNGQSGFKRSISVHKRQHAYINEFLRARV